MTHRPTLSVLLAACGCATASPSTEPSLSFVTLMGVSAPERIPGYVAFEAHRMEDAEWGVTFMYTPPLDAEPGIRLRVHPIPDSASATYLRDTFANELEQRARPRRTGPQTRSSRRKPSRFWATTGSRTMGGDRPRALRGLGRSAIYTSLRSRGTWSDTRSWMTGSPRS